MQTAPVASMPPILRRRADPADRLALEVAFRLAPGGAADGEGMPSVFATRHGQVARSTAMIHAAIAGEPASPMDFSLSVHNATAGQYSIAAGNRAASSSLSSRGESFSSALLEAQGMILEGKEKVLAVVSDLAPPAILDGHWDGEPAGYALGLILGSSGGEEFEMALDTVETGTGAHAGSPAGGADSLEPQALAFLRALAGNRGSVSWSRGSRRWTWTRP
jgi:hypothetical protein